MGMVRLDLGAVRDAADESTRVARDFEGADGSARTAADACGHDRLAGTIEDFAGSWDRRRGEFAEALRLVGETLSAIETSFGELDATFATSIGDATAAIDGPRA